MHAGGFTPDGKTVVTAGGANDGSIRTWNPKTGECIATIAASPLTHSVDGITCMAFSADSTVLVTGGVEGSVVMSNIASGKPVAQVKEHTDSIEAVAFAHGLPLVVSASMDGKVIIWDIGAASMRGVCELPDGVVALAMQHRGPLFASACIDGAVRVFDVRTAQLVTTLRGHKEVVQAVTWAPDDVHLMSGSDDHTVRIFEVSQ
jgi:ribosome assembly protein SQT1